MIELKSNKEHEITVTNTKMEKHSPESTKCNVDLSYKEYFTCTADKMDEKIRACDQWRNHCSHINTNLKCDSKDCQGSDPHSNYPQHCCKRIKVFL